MGGQAGRVGPEDSGGGGISGLAGHRLSLTHWALVAGPFGTGARHGCLLTQLVSTALGLHTCLEAEGGGVGRRGARKGREGHEAACCQLKERPGGVRHCTAAHPRGPGASGGEPCNAANPRHPREPPCRFGGSSSGLEAVVGPSATGGLAVDAASRLGLPWCPPSACLWWRGPGPEPWHREGGPDCCPQQVKSQGVLFLGW